MIVNFSQNITSKSLKISHPIFLISPKKSVKSRSLDLSWNQRLKWRDFDGCIRMKTYMLCGSPVAQRSSILLLTVNCTAEHHKPLFWRPLATKLTPLVVPQLCPDYMNSHVPTCTERIRRRGGRLASWNGLGSRRIHPPCVIDAGTQGICRTDFRVEWIWLFGVLERSAWPKSLSGTAPLLLVLSA